MIKVEEKKITLMGSEDAIRNDIETLNKFFSKVLAAGIPLVNFAIDNIEKGQENIAVDVVNKIAVSESREERRGLTHQEIMDLLHDEKKHSD